MNDSLVIYNYLSEKNNAKIAYCTSETDNSNSSNILNNKIKVSIYIVI